MVKPYRILHVDDDYFFIKIIEKLFGDENFKVDSVDSGGKAVGHAFRNTYDVVLMDICMPNMDGRVAAKTIKSMTPKLPIIALTSSDDDDLYDLPQFDSVIKKPVDKSILIDTICKYLHKRKI